jgi:hypothetical protein
MDPALSVRALSLDQLSIEVAARGGAASVKQDVTSTIKHLFLFEDFGHRSSPRRGYGVGIESFVSLRTLL